jgi:chromosome partitioning protein
LRVIAVANQKGGCGKTTSSINFAASLAHLKKRVLLVDLDPQGHCGCGLGLDPEYAKGTLYDLLCVNPVNYLAPADVLVEINESLDLLPSTTSLACLEEELANAAGREKRLLHEVLQPLDQLKSYDYIILDCPPNLGILTLNAFMAAGEVIIPIEPSFFSLHGLAKMSETLKQINAKRRIPLQDHALLTIFNSEARFSKDIYDEVSKYFKTKLFKTIIHENVLLKEAASAGQSIIDYFPDSEPYRDYLNLGLEYLERELDRILPVDQLGWNNVLRTKYGPKRVMGGVLFQCMNMSAKEIEIAGDFNNWVPEKMMNHSSTPGLWQKIISMPSGDFRYKFIVDGEWQLDYGHPFVKENQFGCNDSYLKVV